MPNSVMVNGAVALPLACWPLKSAVTVQVMGLVTPCTVRLPAIWKVAAPEVGSDVSPLTAVGSKTACGYCDVCRVLRCTKASRMDSSLLSDVRSTMILEAAASSCPYRVRTICPLTPLVAPTATLGKLLPANCSCVWYSALALPPFSARATSPAGAAVPLLESCAASVGGTAPAVGEAALSLADAWTMVFGACCELVASWASLAAGAMAGVPQAAPASISPAAAAASRALGRG